MSDITLYHNPSCSKSRQTLELLESKGHRPNVIRYLDNPPNSDELKTIVGLLGVDAIDIVRTGESEFTQEMKTFTEKQLLEAVASTPKLLQRPIVIANNQARIGRPPESVLEIL